jgi:hypothetical protein
MVWNEDIDSDEVSDELLQSLVDQHLTRRRCRQCDTEDLYKVRGGYNDRYDCRHCGAKDAIQT